MGLVETQRGQSQTARAQEQAQLQGQHSRNTSPWGLGDDPQGTKSLQPGLQGSQGQHLGHAVGMRDELAGTAANTCQEKNLCSGKRDDAM